MGASSWDYFVPYQPDLAAALRELRDRVFADGDYWWAQGRELGKAAADRPGHPRTIDELSAQEATRRAGTHSILDMHRLLAPGERPRPGTVEPVTPEEALDRTGTTRPTREHAIDLEKLAVQRWYGRCAVLHDDAGEPKEIYFFGYSGV